MGKKKHISEYNSGNLLDCKIDNNELFSTNEVTKRDRAVQLTSFKAFEWKKIK